MENNYVHAIAHPTCRMIGRREPFDLDMEDFGIEDDSHLHVFTNVIDKAPYQSGLSGSNCSSE